MDSPRSWAISIPFGQLNDRTFQQQHGIFTANQIERWQDLAQSYYSATLVSIAIGATLAVSVPLILHENHAEGDKPSFGEPGLTVAWLVNYLVFAYFIGGLLWILVKLHPIVCVALCIAPFVAWHAALRVGRAQSMRKRSEELHGAVPVHDEAFRLVASIIEYARTLSNQHKDKALLDLHRNTTRILHLLGAHEVRVELGTLALHAAQRANDVEQESAILLDDLGWANFEAGKIAEAQEHIAEAVELLKAQVNGSEPVPDALRVWLAKGNRHLAALSCRTDLDAALAHISNAEAVIQNVDPCINIREQAGLDIAYGYVVAENLTYRFGDGILTKNTLEGQHLRAAMERLKRGVRTYEKIGDIERAAKGAAILVRVYATVPRKEREKRLLLNLSSFSLWLFEISIDGEGLRVARVDEVGHLLYSDLLQPHRKFVAIRHAASCKNLAGIHGGRGMRLADIGVIEAERMAKVLGHRGFGSKSRVVTTSILQAEQTADVIQCHLGCSVLVDDNLIGINLGVLHSLTEEQAWKDYPDAMKLLDDWRTGLSAIERLQLVNAEHPGAFCERITNALYSHVHQGVDIFVATRSTMIMLANLVAFSGYLDLSNYYASNWQTCEALWFENGEARREQL